MLKENKQEKDDVIILDEKSDEFDLGKDELDLSPDNDEDFDDFDSDSGGDD